VSIALKSKPGLTGSTALSIPATWDATWFRHFIHNMLKGADVRNSIGANGIKITGNIASPYATIGFGGPASFAGPITITAATGQVTLTVNGASGQPAIVAVPGSATDYGLAIEAATGGNSAIEFLINGVLQGLVGVSGAAGQMISGSAVNDLNLRSINGAVRIASGAGSSSNLTIGTSGNVTVAGNLGVNNVAPPAQVTGFGSPVGAAVVLNYNITDAGGANSNTNKCVAEILTVLKNFGLIGA
jgi:hypothetical protein